MISRSEYEWKIIADFLLEVNQDLRNSLVIANSELKEAKAELGKLMVDDPTRGDAS